MRKHRAKATDKNPPDGGLEPLTSGFLTNQRSNRYTTVHTSENERFEYITVVRK